MGSLQTPFIFVISGGYMLESSFQSKLIKELKERYPGCLVLKNDPNYIQGIPDLLILYNDRWAALECKKSSSAHHQPNQEYYIDKMNYMSFARCIDPSNKLDIFLALDSYFEGE